MTQGALLHIDMILLNTFPAYECKYYCLCKILGRALTWKSQPRNDLRNYINPVFKNKAEQVNFVRSKQQLPFSL